MKDGRNQINLRISDELVAAIKKFQLELSTKRGKMLSMHSIIVEAITENIARDE
jgi:hypothetical protein